MNGLNGKRERTHGSNTRLVNMIGRMLISVCGLCLFVLFIFCFEGKIIFVLYFKEIIIAPYYKEICVHVQMKSQKSKYFPYTKSPRWQTCLN